MEPAPRAILVQKLAITQYAYKGNGPAAAHFPFLTGLLLLGQVSEK